MTESPALIPKLADALSAIAILDQGDRWSATLSKDVPSAITQYVLHELRTGRDIDKIKVGLGFRAASDPRWRKIMAAIRTGQRVDATGIFVKWLERNEALGDKLAVLLDEALANERPINKFLLSALQTLSTLQVNTVKIGKDLGVFVDPGEAGKGAGQGVTIVVQTNVPMPDAHTIVVNQQEQLAKAKARLAENRPVEFGGDKQTADPTQS